MAAPRKGRGQRAARARIRLERGGVMMDTPPWGRGYAGGDGHKEAELQHQAERERGLTRPRPQKGRD